MLASGLDRRHLRHGGRSQELEKYRRESEVAFGPVDTVKYAEAFGATGLMIRTPDEVAPILKRAFEIEGPVLIGVHVDYRDNHVLFESVLESGIV
jgi:acetolactate synthase-1/2/3 large subunit